MIAPGSDVYFTHIDFEKNGLHVSNDVNLFSKLKSKAKHILDNYTFLKKDVINVNVPIAEIEKCNYVIYENGYYSNKEFGAFITNYEYINNNLTKVTIETDYFHTFFNDITLKKSFIERTHVLRSEDIKGKFTIPENLNIGEYIEGSNELELYSGNTVILLMVNAEIKKGVLDSSGNIDTNFKIDATEYLDNMLNGYFTALKGNRIYEGKIIPYKILMFDPRRHFNEFYKFISNFVELGGSEYILSIYLAPSDFLPKSLNDISAGEEFPLTTHLQEVTKNFNGLSNNIEGYIPKNNKLFTYPYCFARLQNGSGQEKIIRYENQKKSGTNYGNIELKSIGTISSPAPVVHTYVNSNRFFDETDFISIGGYPQLPWNNNTYKAWFANNAGNLILKATSALVSVGSAVASGGSSLLLSTIAGGTVNSIINEVGNFSNSQKNVARTEGSVAGNTVNVMRNKLNSSIQAKTITSEYAKIIDDYFEMFGYKVNVNEVPKINTRYKFNFIKTNGFNFTGDIPENARNYIKNMFDKGVTIWHDYNSIYDYTNNN